MPAGQRQRETLDQELTHLWILRDGNAVRLETYSTKRDALEAVGLSE